MIFGERETFDGLIAYTLDMENTVDIPRATSNSEMLAVAEDILCHAGEDGPVEPQKWLTYVTMKEFEKSGALSSGDFDTKILSSDNQQYIDSLLELIEIQQNRGNTENVDHLNGVLLDVISRSCSQRMTLKPTSKFIRRMLDSLDTRPWWAVRLY